MIRRAMTALGLVATLVLAGCGKDESKTLRFSFESASDQGGMSQRWQPVLDDLQKQSGLKVEPAVGIMPSGMGMGGIPRPLPPREESEKETKAETHAIVTDKPEPAFAQAQIKEV